MKAKKKTAQLAPGDLAVSRAGHDRKKVFAVVGLVGDDFVLIADGKTRTVEKPKLKRRKHLDFFAGGEAIAEKLAQGNITDADIAAHIRDGQREGTNV